MDDLQPRIASLERASAETRVDWALARAEGRALLTSSFGAQAAVMLHLVTRRCPRIPVVLIDTGYLFPETYRFVDELEQRLDLDLRVYTPRHSPAWLQVRHGRLWEQGADGLERYNRLHKVEPMARALDELEPRVWFAGLRRAQSRSRESLPVARREAGAIKVHPIVDWSDRDVHRYLRRHDLPYHPLWAQGYVSIGDVHTTRPLGEGMCTEDTRFFGVRRECGLHEAFRET